MSKVLHLVLKHKWYDMIERGEKKEEYRDPTMYWIKRIFDLHNSTSSLIVKHNIVCFHRGYTNRIMSYEINDVVISTGKEEWGAEPIRKYLVIRLGKRIN